MKILLIVNNTESSWLKVTETAMDSIGELEIVLFHEMLQQPILGNFDLVLVDADQDDKDVVNIVTSLHKNMSGTPIVVATSSPTWQRARQILLAGGADYIRKSFDTNETKNQIYTVLDRSRDRLST